MARKSYQKGNVQFHNGQWTLRYRERDHARKKWITKRVALEGAADKKSALLAADPVMRQVNERNNDPRIVSKPSAKAERPLTFADFVSGPWKSYADSAKHAESTTVSNNSLTKVYLMPVFGGKQMSRITPADVTCFFDGLKEKVSGLTREKITARTISKIYGLLHVMFEVASQYDLIEKNPVRPKLHRPCWEALEKPKLDIVTLRALLEATPPVHRLFLLVLAVTGVRLGEGLGFRWLNFNAGRSELSVTHSLYKGRLKVPKTEASKRPLHLPKVLADLLVKHRMKSGWNRPEDFIFSRPDGTPYKPRWVRDRVLYPAMDAVGLERKPRQYGFHIFRHTAGSIIYSKSRDLKLTQETLGHSRIATTSDIYVHLDEAVAEEGTEIIAREIFGNCDPQVTVRSEMVS